MRGSRRRGVVGRIKADGKPVPIPEGEGLLTAGAVAGGRQVHGANAGSPRLLDDGNGKGPQYTYEYKIAKRVGVIQ